MQLICDADNIEFKRNMSTIEQESLNEKFLSNKVIEHLTEDINSGNKENIQKQDNIIPDLGEDDNIDTEKDIPISQAVSSNNSSDENSKKEISETESLEGLGEVVSEVSNNETNSKIFHNDNNREEESQDKENETLQDKETIKELGNEVESDIINYNSSVDNNMNEDAAFKDLASEGNAVEMITEEQEETLLDEHAVEKIAQEKEENEMDVDVAQNVIREQIDHNQVDLLESDIVKVSTEAEVGNNKIIDTDTEILEKQPVISTLEGTADKKVKHAELDCDNVQVINKEKEKHADIDYNRVETVDVKNKNQADVGDKFSELDEKETECSIIETNQTTTIEIDDEDEKSAEKSISISSKDQELGENIESKESDENMQKKELNEHMESQELDENMETQELDENLESQELDENMEVQLLQEIIEDQELDDNKKDRLDSCEKPKSPQKDTPIGKATEEVEPKRICKLSNNLDILSDEDSCSSEPPPLVEPPKDEAQPPTLKHCINVDDDDDILLIDEETSTKGDKQEASIVEDSKASDNIEPVLDQNTAKENECTEKVEDAEPITDNKSISTTPGPTDIEMPETTEPEPKVNSDMPTNETTEEALGKVEDAKQSKKPLLPKHFVQTCKKNLADMTRDDLEDFCILKIVESIVDRSNLGEIKTQLKNLTQTMDECRKKCMILTRQNKDLQVVLKSVQEEQKCAPDVNVTPLKITRSVGMQVVMMLEKSNSRKKSVNNANSPIPYTGVNPAAKPVKSAPNQNNRNNKEKSANNQQIPVPRLVPAVNTGKTNLAAINNVAVKQNNVSNTFLPNGIRSSPPGPKMPEKRPRSNAVTVDLTDDEPPTKLPTMQRGGITQSVRVAGTPPNVLPTQRFAANMNSPRKVYIPISGPQAQNVRPGQTIMLKTVAALGPRQRCPTPNVGKLPQNTGAMRMGRLAPNRHPAPLPDAMKQYQPPNWKALPPAPDLKLSKVENGIVISWKIDGYQEENHEEIASYQLYAYQETNTPPSTALWKKIGDVKALPLPMACTLTQFMAGFKYYFAVRAVDIKTRFGPFSLPGSILLLNKM